MTHDTTHFSVVNNLTSLRKKGPASTPAAAAPSTGGETSTKGRRGEGGGRGGGGGGESMAEVLQSFPMPNFKDCPSGVDIVVTVRELEKEQILYQAVINILGR
jgi:hypothetical protein